MAPKWTDEDNVRFIEFYRDNRCLWDQHSSLYKDKNARKSALENIAAAMDMKGLGAEEVKAKIKALRGTFNIEFSKQKKSMKSGAGADEIYTPSLKWFHIMHDIVAAGTLKRETKSSTIPVSLLNDDSLESNSSKRFREEDEEDNLEFASENDTPLSTALEDSAGDSQANKKRKGRSKIQQIAATARELKQLGESIKNSENEFDVFGRYVAARLKKLSPFQAATAEMEINNILAKCRFADMSSDVVHQVMEYQPVDGILIEEHDE